MSGSEQDENVFQTAAGQNKKGKKDAIASAGGVGSNQRKTRSQG